MWTSRTIRPGLNHAHPRLNRLTAARAATIHDPITYAGNRKNTATRMPTTRITRNCVRLGFATVRNWPLGIMSLALGGLVQLGFSREPVERAIDLFAARVIIEKIHHCGPVLFGEGV